jgi:pyroglutamyl-peptidase
MKIILAGFNRFSDLDANPTELIIQNIAKNQDRIFALTLETDYSVAGNKIRHLIRQKVPDIVICLGVSPGTSSIGLERTAVNLDDDLTPDNSGRVLIGQEIVSNGPQFYRSTLPLGQIQHALKLAGIPVYTSDDAGRYVCNHVFYLARYQIEQLGWGKKVKCGFIHVPLIAEQVKDDSIPSLPFRVLIDTIELCICVSALRA